ncbi:hypothetical protein [Mycolicibacterium sp.]|uniref:hypothetical protein n=1 Tax=Mycolicibacterium sp. TaxID=2320850 RepID=UPI001A2E1F6B|nr:hypothetical protein [Mycolicibacterium sp.]MBJ7338020.1 hypothetical protein [Mycolicibacterium sp.]
MPIAVQFDQPVGGRLPRAQMHGGAINVTSPTTQAIKFAMFARELIGEAFGGRDPELAQFDLPVAEYAAILNALEARFVDHPESTRLLQDLLAERGCDPETTYFDVPRLRVSTSDDYLGAGTAYAWHPRRDTWHGAPLAQLTHWMPVFDVSEANAMVCHAEYFNQAIANDSADFDYDEWKPGRRPLPGPTDTVDPFSGTVFVIPVGGVLEFSGHHLHSDVPNDSGRTRFSIDFHTVDVSDIRAGLGARNVDGHCTGSSIQEFISAADLSAVPQDVVALVHGGTTTGGDHVQVQPTHPALTNN